MTERALRGQVAMSGIGEPAYCVQGQSLNPAFELTLTAILAACDDVVVDRRDTDSLVSNISDRNGPSCLTALLITEHADIAVLNQNFVQGQFARFGQAKALFAPHDNAPTLDTRDAGIAGPIVNGAA